MKSFLVISILALLCGGCSDEAEYRRRMHRYEETCDRYFATYASSDLEGAQKALGQIIALSLAEKKKATRYWRFDVQIAYAQARLAVIAERQGRNEEADKLFASASEYFVAQNRAFSQELRRTHVAFKESSDAEMRLSREQWRKNVAALDTHANVKWKEPGQHAGANGRRSFSDTNPTPATVTILEIKVDRSGQLIPPGGGDPASTAH